MTGPRGHHQVDSVIAVTPGIGAVPKRAIAGSGSYTKEFPQDCCHLRERFIVRLGILPVHLAGIDPWMRLALAVFDPAKSRTILELSYALRQVNDGENDENNNQDIEQIHREMSLPLAEPIATVRDPGSAPFPWLTQVQDHGSRKDQRLSLPGSRSSNHPAPQPQCPPF